MHKPVRIIIADDIRPFVKGLREMLTEIPNFTVVGEVLTVSQVVSTVQSLKPDVIFIDINWREDRGGISTHQHNELGLRAIKDIKTKFPEVAVIAMTAYSELIESARQNGADIALQKERLNNFEELEDCVLRAIEIARSPTRQRTYEPLTERERQILTLMAQGLTESEIAEHLRWGVGVVKRDSRAIFDKLQVRNRAHAVARAYDLGILSKGSSWSPETE
jgi:DNA-binding NarL/FixJ family response regulator